MKEEEKTDIRGLSFEELKKAFSESGEKPYRASQLYEWLWQKSATTFEEMSNIPKSTREWLAQNYRILPVTIKQTQTSTDKTIKLALELHDGHLVEGVLIPTKSRMTACISSQVGCSLSCKFCATGFMERERNLDAGEIYDQVALINTLSEKTYGKPLTNIVYMGMGEPLLNYQNMMQSVSHITGEKGLNMSPKRITVSTAGIGKMICKLADDGVKFNLALSLHAANDEKRSQIMPINETNDLDTLQEALNYFYHNTRNKVTLEYILLNKFNDSLDDAKELLKFARKVPCKINIIEYNPVARSGFTRSLDHMTRDFSTYLENNGVVVNVRRSRGKDIKAACGQLANSVHQES